MLRDAFNDLAVFLTIAEERSFTRAAARLGTSQSALSQTVRKLEARLGLKLLARTTRSVRPTEVGERLLETLGPALHEISERLFALRQMRETPAGLVRITCSRHAAQTVLWPAIDGVLRRYRDIQIELSIDGALTDIVTDRFDAGVRLGEQVEKDMIAVRIGPDLRMAVVGSPSYFEGAGLPASPRDLPHHRCINLRMATKGNLYVWEFEEEGRALRVRVDGSFIVNDSETALRAALAGHGLAFVMEDLVEALIAEGRLVRALDLWCPRFPGHHLYYPDRRDLSPAFAVVVNALRFPPRS